VKLLLDTHVLLWAAGRPERLSSKARRWLNDAENTLVFSVASLWEVAIKRSIGRRDFSVDPRQLRRGLLDNGYDELNVTAAHVLALSALPPLHKDPFDRMLVAQSAVEGITLVTSDRAVARYSDTIETI